MRQVTQASASQSIFKGPQWLNIITFYILKVEKKGLAALFQLDHMKQDRG